MTNVYTLNDTIFRFLAGSSTRSITLPKITQKLVEYLRSMGYAVSVIDDDHRDYRIIEVDEHHFRIIRWTDWLRYDSVIID